MRKENSKAIKARQVKLAEIIPSLEEKLKALEAGAKAKERRCLKHAIDRIPRVRELLTKKSSFAIGCLVPDGFELRMIYRHCGIRHAADFLYVSLADMQRYLDQKGVEVPQTLQVLYDLYHGTTSPPGALPMEDWFKRHSCPNISTYTFQATLVNAWRTAQATQSASTH